LIATRRPSEAPPATLVAFRAFVAGTTFVFVMNRTAFFDLGFLGSPSLPGRFLRADGRAFAVLFFALLCPTFLVLSATLRSPVTPVFFLTFATCAPRLLQQTLHEFGIFSVS
jgi:hypothetical protein